MSEKVAEILPVLSLAFLFLVGLGMGASTTLDDFKQAFKTPRAVAIGFLSQYLFMPIAAFLLALAFQVRNEIVVGAVLVGCSPGGTTSNLFTYWAKGDVALSITMSFLSTIAAFALMPFWIWVLLKKALDSGAEVDFFRIIIGLLLILIPTCLGLTVRRYNTEKKIGGKFIWKWVEIFSSVLGVVFLIVVVIIYFLAYGNKLSDVGYEVWIMCILLQPLGCAFGYFGSKLFGMSLRHMQTISLETGVQNFSLTIAVIQLSFQSDEDTMEYAMIFPLCYGLLYMFWSPIIILYFRYQSKCLEEVEKESQHSAEHDKINEFPISVDDEKHGFSDI